MSAEKDAAIAALHAAEAALVAAVEADAEVSTAADAPSATVAVADAPELTAHDAAPTSDAVVEATAASAPVHVHGKQYLLSMDGTYLGPTAIG